MLWRFRVVVGASTVALAAAAMATGTRFSSPEEHALPGTILGGVSVAAATAETPLPLGQRCKKAGLRFVGKTSQGGTICFTLARDAKRFLELGFAFRTRCSTRIGVVAFDGPPKERALPLRPDGSFSFNYIGVYVLPVGAGAKDFVFGSTNVDNTLFQGKLLRTKQAAAGSLRMRPKPSVLEETVCDSGKVSWSTRKIGA